MVKIRTMYVPMNWNIDMDKHGSESINMDSKLHKDAYSITTYKPCIFKPYKCCLKNKYIYENI